GGRRLRRRGRRWRGRRRLRRRRGELRRRGGGGGLGGGRDPKWGPAFLSQEDLPSIAHPVRRRGRAHSPGGGGQAGRTSVGGARGRHRRAEPNGVLIYISVSDHKLAVIGDAGIHERVGEAYWRGLVDGVRDQLRQQRSREGLLQAIAEVGEALGRHFPRRPDDVNELPDDVSIGR